MRSVEILQTIRKDWYKRIMGLVAREENVRASFADPLNKFLDLLIESIASDDPTFIKELLDEWIEIRIPIEEGNLTESLSVVLILEHILLAAYETIKVNVDSSEGLSLIGEIIPVYIYAHNYTVQKETKLNIEQVSNELGKARIALENLDKNKSDFISVAAHELKTPMTLIGGYASMLREGYTESEQDSENAIYLKGMENGIRRLQEIVNDMIDVSMIDNNMLTLNFQPIWIKQLLDIARHELACLANQRSQTLQVLEFDGSQEMTYGDPERLYQALRNLIINAIKYTPDGGKITLDGRKLTGFVEITITDTGIGIDEADHQQIFDKFGRLGSSQFHSSGKTKFKGGGVGLGLPITKGLIEAHGGAIWVESEGYDEIRCPGTTFHVLLPLLKESPNKKFAKLFQSLDVIKAEKD